MILLLQNGLAISNFAVEPFTILYAAKKHNPDFIYLFDNTISDC
jgi:hypothetical protein